MADHTNKPVDQSLDADSQNTKTNKKQNKKSNPGQANQAGSIITPEATPAPDNGRLESDKSRSQNIAEGSSGETQTNEEKELARILSCKEDKYHEILQIEEDYDDDGEMVAITSAVYNLGTMVHPKHNKDIRAEKAWNMVRNAGNILGCPDSILEEVENYTEDNSRDSAENDSMEGIQNSAPPSKMIVAIYQKATPFMAQLLINPKSYNAKKKLEKLNDEIRSINKGEGQVDPDRWTIDFDAISNFYAQAQPFVNRLRKNNGDEDALRETNKIKQELDKFLSDNHYLAWTLDEIVLEKTPINPVPPETSAPPTASVPAVKAAPAAPLPVWRPGLTAKCERILGMSPFERTDIHDNTHILRCSFYIEKKGELNPMACEDSGKIGKKATHAYLHDIPQSEQRDLRINKKKYTTADQEGFVGIKAIHAKDGYASTCFPDTTIWAEYEEGIEDKVLKRSSFRQIWGSHTADRMIEDFYIEKDLRIPWQKKAKRTGTSRLAAIAERGRGSRDENRRRAPSTTSYISLDSSASYLTDEGLQRVEEVENRMRSLEKLMARVDAKLDKALR